LQFHHKKNIHKNIETIHTLGLYFPFLFFSFLFTSPIQIPKQLNKNYNNSPKTIWNLQGTPSAPTEQCQADFWSCKTVAARLLHAPRRWRRVGSRAAAKNPGKQGDPKQLLLFFFLGLR